jgi:hypothetical protein
MRCRWSWLSAVWERTLEERVAGVMQRARERRVNVDVQGLEAVAVEGWVEDAGQRLRVGQGVGVDTEHGAHGLGGGLGPPRGVVHEQGSPRAELGVDAPGQRVAVPLQLRPPSFHDLRRFVRRLPDLLEEGGIEDIHAIDHLRDHGDGLGGDVSRPHHPPQAMEHDPGDGVHHRGEGGHGDDVTRELDGFLLGFARDLLPSLLRRVRAEVADLSEDAVRVLFQDRGEGAIGRPGLAQLALVHLARRCGEGGGDIGRDLVEAHEPLAGLLGVVERVGMQEGPDQLPAHVLEAELEVGVLVDGVMPALEGQGADGVALARRDLVRPDHPRGIAGAGGGDGAVVRARRGVAQGDEGGAGT